MPATMQAGMAIPGAPTSRPMTSRVAPVRMTHMGQSKGGSWINLARAGFVRLAINQPATRIRRIPRTNCVRFLFSIHILLI